MSAKQMRGASRSSKIALGGLTLFMLVRLGFAALVFARPELAVQNDTDRYRPIAMGLIQDTAYTWDTERPGELLSTIGYPLFLAGVYATLGTQSGDVAIAQLLLSGLVALAVYGAASRWLGAWALVPAAILLIDPLTVLWSMTILTETLFASMLAIAAVLLAIWSNTRNNLVLFLAGLFGGLACLVRPVGMLVIAAWATAAYFAPDGSSRERRGRLWLCLVSALILVLPAAILIAPWYARNAALWHCPGLSSVDRVTMRDYVAGKILVETRHVTIEEAQAALQAEDPGPCPNNTLKYWNMVVGNPATYARLHLGGTLSILAATSFDRWLQYFGRSYSLPDLWRPYMDSGWKGLFDVLTKEMRRFPLGLGVMFILTGFQTAVYVLAVLGAYVAVRYGSGNDRWLAVALLLTILIQLVTPGQGGNERFRVPLQPLFALLSGYWYAWRGARARSKVVASAASGVA